MRLAAKLQGVPKPMAPVGGRPFLEILLNQLRHAGCTRVILSVGHLHHVIQNHFGATWRGMRLDYEIEKTPLGTGGAIRSALVHAVGENVLVLNGDTYLQADYAAMMRFHAMEGAKMTMAVTHLDDVGRYGGVVIDETRIVGFEEKGRSGPGWINAGSYVLNRELKWPGGLAEKFSFETDFLATEIEWLTPAAYKVEGIFLDIGVPEDLERAQTDLTAIEF